MPSETLFFSYFVIFGAFLASALVVISASDGPSSLDARPRCRVRPLGDEKDDSPYILSAFKQCNKGGTVVFPENETYWIDTFMNPVLEDVRIEWRGQWLFSDKLAKWRNQSLHVPFQNHAAGFVISGRDIRINGHSTGGINGNGDAWYSEERGKTQPGRPMPFVLWNVTDVSVKKFNIRQPQFWAINIMNGTNVTLSNIYVNATSKDAEEGVNWVQNTDGFDTLDAYNITLRNFTYTGGDDCVAIKPRSKEIHIHNATCHGGNGIAIGSLGQYEEDSSVTNVVIDNVTIHRINNDMHNSAYIKTWVGVPVAQREGDYESAGLPRGGGWGSVTNITFSNFVIEGADSGPAITQENGGNGKVEAGSSLMRISDVRFVNFTGFLSGGGRGSSVSCSRREPCEGIRFEGMSVTVEEGSSRMVGARCKFVGEGGVVGLEGDGCS
ncbi:glycoside hydrolase family 28 protein [Aulographum hederae CBS 113979]|uniref:galacturonan 1,4-alpha-galacturonidase n=1 Tax=Aulographum hederae CBS 113979 TaxID=1176131 RepID=A0A6G1HCV6_9PEZI|nr:glycoside hydrolase family 28 protein [Aulographum hederae CBS 113979]